MDALLADQELARMQLYIPGFSSVLNVDTSSGSAVAVISGIAEEVQRIASAGYLTGFSENQILSMELSRAFHT